MSIVFVILHYLAIEETEESIKYIKDNIDIDDYYIIIVDNASPDNSGRILQEKYEHDKKITVLINSLNLGFAKGNNVGFRYARDVLKADFIVLMNNDVFLTEKFFYNKILKEYEKSHFSVLGPMVLTADGKCNANPQKSSFSCIEDIEREIVNFKIAYRRAKFNYTKICLLFEKLKNILLKRTGKKGVNFIERQENVKLHGCFWVFSPVYIQKFDGLDESTFMYLEEEFLYKHMISNQQIMVYLPDIQVYHKEDASTDKAISTSRQKIMFICEHHITSLTELRKVFEYYDE